ncbi:MAG: hypothetical protein K2P09_03050 [Erysipelotrichales bacterium]|nr:hypothetical protein [Erysipelotrichales bacterium]
MNREELEGYIYTETLLAQLYRKAAAMATRDVERNTLLQFSQEATQNANYLNYFYRQEFGSNFDPIIPEGNITGTYRDILNEILNQEIRSFLVFRNQTYFQNNFDFKETMRYISDIKLGHILTILAILTDMNKPVQQ